MKLTDYCTVNPKKIKPFDGLKKYIATGDIDKTKIIDFSDVSYENRPSRANVQIKKDDLLFAKMKDTRKVLIGSENNIDYIYSTGFYCLTPNKNIKPKILYYFLQSNIFNIQKDNNCSGATMKALNDDGLKNIKVTFPDLNIQEKIIRELDLISSLIENRKKTIEDLNDFSKSLFIEMFGNPVINDKKWKTELNKNLCSKIGSGATPKGGNSVYLNKGISFIRSMNVYDNYFEYKDLAYIDNKIAEELANVELKENDILLNITGASVCRCCIVPKELLPARVNQHVSILRYKNANVNFMLYQLINYSFKENLNKISKSSGATREALTKSQLENLVFIVPPIELQNKFSKIITQINKQKNICQKDIIDLEKILEIKMNEYFS